MKTYIIIMDAVNKWVLGIIMAVLAMITLLTIYQVFSRFVLGSSVVWSEEIVRHSMIWVILLGTAIALRRGQTISIETLVNFIPIKFQRSLSVIVVSINILFLSILFYYGLTILPTTNNQTGGSLALPVTWYYLAIPVGAFLCILNSIVTFFELYLKEEVN